jgi:hypothetical protein
MSERQIKWIKAKVIKTPISLQSHQSEARAQAPTDYFGLLKVATEDVIPPDHSPLFHRPFFTLSGLT